MSTACEAYPTGFPELDGALGIGGLPRGRVVEVFGPEASGKTTLMLKVVAAVQAAGGVAAYIDAEHVLDMTYARNLGVNPACLLVSQPDSGEEALEIAAALARSGAVDMIVVDSVAALVPKVELEGEMGDQHVGLQARLMSQALRKLTAVVARTGTAVVFINRLRHEIGVALEHYASVQLAICCRGQIKQSGRTVGCRMRVKVVKNMLVLPFQEAEFDIHW